MSKTPEELEAVMCAWAGRCLGIPASTLGALRAGTMVAVNVGIDFGQAHDSVIMTRVQWVDGEIRHTVIPEAEWRMLAAAQPRRDEGNGDG